MSTLRTALSTIGELVAPTAGPAGFVARRVRESVALQQQIAEPATSEAVARAGLAITAAMRAGGKLVIFGNGGSAADAAHMAAELTGRFLRERRPLAALALTDNASALTAIANDYSFADVFARQLRALCRPEDAVLAISTSGDSANVIAGVDAARLIGATAIGLTGAGGGRLRARCDQCISVPSSVAPRIQEGHTLIAHILCEMVESALCEDA